MRYQEFLRQLGKAGLTVREFAELIRMNRVSISNNAKKGQIPSHLAVIASLMGEMAENGVDYRAVLSRIDVEPRKARGVAGTGKFGGDPQVSMFPSRTGAPSGRPKRK